MPKEGTPGHVDDRLLFRQLLIDISSDPANRDNILTDGRQSCAYHELPEHLERIGRHLRSAGIRPDDCITIAVNNSLRGGLTVLSLLWLGQSFMTMPVLGQGSRANATETRYARFSRVVLSVDTKKPERAIGDTAPSDYLSLEANPAFDETAKRPAAGDPYMFFRTSGSTGAAKLAAYRYQAFYMNALTAWKVRGFNASHRITLPTPIFHVYGLGAGFLAGLAGGSSMDLQERSNILRFLDREADFEPNIAYVTPTFCEMLIRGRRSKRPYEFMITSGDRISESTFARCEDLHGPMINQYGATELGIVAAGRLDMPFETRARTVGRTVPGVEHRIVPLPDHPDDSAGELQIRHAHGFDGYVDLDGRDLVPEKSFDGDWYRTGDLAAMRDDGMLTVRGRCDLSINRNGVLVPLAEVESRMRELGGVEEVAVAPGRENIRGRALVAYCVVGRNSTASADALRSGYAAISPAYSVPEIVRIMPELPKLESGKVDRQALARLAAEELVA